MEGQGSSVGSLQETLGFDHGSTAADPVIEPQICWNSIRSYSQNDSHITDTNPINQGGSNLSGWNIGEPSSCQMVHNNDGKVEHDWFSSMNKCNGSNPIPEDCQRLNSNFIDSTPQAEDLNMSSGIEGPIMIDDIASQEMDIPLPDSDGFQGFLEENDVRRLNCKRKALEGQSSAGGSSSYFRPGDCANRNVNNGLIISDVNPRLGLSVGGGVVSEIRPNVAVQSLESSRSNLRLRINTSSNQQDSGIPNNNNMISAGHHRLLRLNLFNDVESAVPPPLPMLAPAIVAAETIIPQGPRRNLSSSRWNRGSSSRSNGFFNSSAEEERNIRTVRNNVPENQIFSPHSQSVIDWSFSTGVSYSRGANHLPAAVAPSWAPDHRHGSHYPRRLREFVHRSLVASESGGQNGNVAVPASSSQEILPLSGGRERQVPHSRAAMLTDRQQRESAFGIPYQMRSLSAGGDGRNRLVSEHIRNVLDLMRRGEGLRFEDVTILDQSVFLGMAVDIHDRHRDLRLDVDNMSYEELLALEERIGNVNTGLSEDNILSRLKLTKYVPLTIPLEDPIPCCVCQEEYNDGDYLGMLECGHDFHSECIKRWLTHKNLCPICKTTALITSQ